MGITRRLQDTNARRFAQSFRKTTELGGNKKCTLKRHFRGAMREVVGFLELLASKDKERFVWASAGAIVERCRKFGSKETYSVRWVKYALAQLRAKHIISSRIMRQRAGAWREGFIVAPHDHLTIRSNQTACTYVGLAAPFDCWKQHEDGSVIWVGIRPAIARQTPGKGTPEGSLGDAFALQIQSNSNAEKIPDSALRSAPHSAQASALHSAPSNAPHSALHSALPQSAPQCTPPAPQVSDVPSDVVEQPSAWRPENGPSRGSVLAGCNPESPLNPVSPASPQTGPTKAMQHRARPPLWPIGLMAT